jgi:hypothetical protein
MGIKPYCKDLFKEQKFYFWANNELAENCDNVEAVMQLNKEKDECAVVNDHIYGKYHEKQNLVLLQVQELTKKLISKKNEKIERLKNFVQLKEKEESNTFVIKEEVASRSKAVHEEVCKYISQFDDGNDQEVMSVCDKNGKSKVALVEK